MSRFKFRWMPVAWLTLVCAASATLGQSRPSVVADGAKLTKIGHGYRFTEGPAADAQGNVCFSDIPASRTYRWATDGTITVFRRHTGNANGLAFDKAGQSAGLRRLAGPRSRRSTRRAA